MSIVPKPCRLGGFKEALLFHATRWRSGDRHRRQCIHLRRWRIRANRWRHRTREWGAATPLYTS